MHTATPPPQIARLDKQEQEALEQLAKIRQRKENAVTGELEHDKEFKKLLKRERELRGEIHHAKLRVTKKKSRVRELIRKAWLTRGERKQDIEAVTKFSKELDEVRSKIDAIKRKKIDSVLPPVPEGLLPFLKRDSSTEAPAATKDVLQPA